MISNLERKYVTSNTEKIENYINKYELEKPIFTTDLYNKFPDMKKGNIRQILRRLFERGEIKRVKPGVYFKPKTTRIIATNSIPSNMIIKEKYMKYNNEVEGYRSGINMANQLNLTNQLANIETIKSNRVGNKKREIEINKGKVIVDAPRVKITSDNYKLLQVLDLLNDFEDLSKVDLETAVPVIIEYLDDLKLTKDGIGKCADAYPLQAQVKFYKTGVYHELIKE